jgi:hypothetical protein
MAHLLGDFIFAGGSNSDTFQNLLVTFGAICQDLGVPMATEKSVNPTTIMAFCFWK